MFSIKLKYKEKGEDKMRKKILKLLLLGLLVFLISACSKNKEPDIETKIFNLESDFKETYQLWVDMKGMGEIKNKEYPKDLRKVASEFKSVGERAKSSGYKKLIDKDEQKLYETYRLLSADIKELAKSLERSKYDQALERYNDIVAKEEKLKE